MISQAGQHYDITHVIKPLNDLQRTKMYDSCEVKGNKQNPKYKDVSFDSVNREARDSYLLRVTKQTIIGTNYNLDYSQIFPDTRKQTMDKAKFTRIIGDVRNQDYSIQLSPNCDRRCKESLSLRRSSRPLPLILKKQKIQEDSLILNRNFTNKLQYSNGSQLKDVRSTQDSFIMNNIDNITKQYFNNKYDSKKKLDKIHKFEYYSGHKYLKEVQERQPSPEYEVINNQHQGIIKRSMGHAKGNVKFDLYRKKIASRYDRLDPQWHTILEYPNKQIKSHRTIDLNKSTNRQINQVHSKYPIRLSLSKVTNKLLI